MKRHRIVYMGTPSFAVVPLKKLLEENFEVAAVVTAPDKPAGRGLGIKCCEVKEFALSKNLPVLQPVSLKDPDFLNELASFGADLFIVVAFRMLPEIVWSMPLLGTFNLHASLLPRYRGAAPVNHAIINGESVTGVTTFMLDKEIDTGDILFQQECPIDPEDDFGSLHDKLARIGASLVIKTTEAIFREGISPVKQEKFYNGPEEFPVAPKLTKETGKIDWKASGESIKNLVRGLSPWPGAWTTIKRGDFNCDLKIFRCAAIAGNPARKEGTLLADRNKRLLVACSDGYIEVKELQMAGKRRIPADEFLRGFRNIEDACFV